MAKIVEFDAGQTNVQIVADESSVSGASQKAGTGGFVPSFEKIKSNLSLEEATKIVGQLAESFSAALQSASIRPNNVEVTFGLEASGELGNFLVSKISGKTNFSVKLTWKYD